MKGFIECGIGKDKALINIAHIIMIWEERKKKSKFIDELIVHIDIVTGSLLVNETYDEIMQKIAEASE